MREGGTSAQLAGRFLDLGPSPPAPLPAGEGRVPATPPTPDSVKCLWPVGVDPVRSIAGKVGPNLGGSIYRSGTKGWPRQAGVFTLVRRRFPEITTSAAMVMR